MATHNPNNPYPYSNSHDCHSKQLETYQSPCVTSLTMLHMKDKTLEVYKAYAAWMYMQHGVQTK